MTAEALVDAVPWAGLGRTQIVKLESGRRQRLSVDELLALATALRVPATSLLPPGAAELNQDATPAQVLESVIEVLDAVRRELVQNHCSGADDER